MKKALFSKIEELAPQFYSLSDYIWDHPEVGYEEHEACRVLTERLAAFGFQVEVGVGGLPTAFRAVYEHGEGGPSLGFLAEYDALPGLGHGCGHHMQGPALILCAEALKAVVSDRPYRLVVYGTPAEEVAPAKQEMWDNGCFRDIDLALMTHGSVNTAVDESSLASMNYVVTFHGTAAHPGLFPERGRSAFGALELAFHGMDLMRAHVADDVRLHYACIDPGTPTNGIPATASGKFFLRNRNSFSYLQQLRERFFDMIKGAALMTGTTYEIDDGVIWPNKIPALVLNETIMKNAAEAGCPELAPPRVRTGTTDFAAVMQHVPGACLRIKMVNPPVTSHTPEFAAAGKTDMAHQAILKAAQALAGACCDVIYDPELLPRIQADYAQHQKTAG